MGNRDIMSIRSRFMLGIVAALLSVAMARAETAVINEQTPWRVWAVQGKRVYLKDGMLSVFAGHTQMSFDPLNRKRTEPNVAWLQDAERLSLQPPENWYTSGYDASVWPRYQMDELNEWVGMSGNRADPDLLLWAVMAQTMFGIEDPGKVNDLKLEVEYIGGVIVYVNGKEVGRNSMPGPEATWQTGKAAVMRGDPATMEKETFAAPQSGIMALAEPYPPECYLQPNGEALPIYRKTDARLQTPELLTIYRQRVRKLSLLIPSSALVKGANLLAVEIRHAPCAPTVSVPFMWSHAGLQNVTLTSASGAGVTAYEKAIQGTQVWNANTEEQITDAGIRDLPEQISLSMARTHLVRGTRLPNAFEPLRPVRMLAPRNGVGIGQVVVSNLDGVKDLSVSVGALRSTHGSAAIPSSAVEVFYAAGHANVPYCDALMTAPPVGKQTVPVWLRVRAPKTQAPGWYTGQATIKTAGRTFSVLLRILVTQYVLPSPADFETNMSFVQSPDNVAFRYGVTPWSDEHWKRMERSFQLMGELGNDVIYVPVLLNQQRYAEPLIRFVRDGDRLKADYTILEQYLDRYLKYHAKPKAVALWIWDFSSANRIADIYEGRQIPSRESRMRTPPVVQVFDPHTGATSRAEIPLIGDAGAEAFYKPLVDGARATLAKRGISERAVLLGLTGDARPSVEDVMLFRQWTPYARWHGVSHWSGDPGSFAYKGHRDPTDSRVMASREGKFISANDQEVGLREDPFGQGYWNNIEPIKVMEERLTRTWDFLTLNGQRSSAVDTSPPFFCLVIPQINLGNWGRIGLDYWERSRGQGPKVDKGGGMDVLNAVSWPAPEGAAPTVRYELLRQGFQLAEARIAIIRAYLKLPEPEQKPYRDLMEQVRTMTRMIYLSQSELAYDWPSYSAAQYAAAAQLTGGPDNARWGQPPP